MDKPDKPRRDFLFLTTGAVAAFGGVALLKPMTGHLAPAGDAKRGFTVDVSKIEERQQLKVLWRGRPIGIRHRTSEEIMSAKVDDQANLRDPESDESRLRKLPDRRIDSRFLIVDLTCSHFGCTTIGEHGDFNGWFCPCHAAHFDTSGRVRKGPAPRNLRVPAYRWVSDREISFFYSETPSEFVKAMGLALS